MCLWFQAVETVTLCIFFLFFMRAPHYEFVTFRHRPVLGRAANCPTTLVSPGADREPECTRDMH